VDFVQSFPRKTSPLVYDLLKYSNNTFTNTPILVWFGLVGLYGTAALYRLYRTGEWVVDVRASECVVDVRACECAELLEYNVLHNPTCGGCTTLHLRPVGEFPPPVPLGECADEVIPFYTPE